MTDNYVVEFTISPYLERQNRRKKVLDNLYLKKSKDWGYKYLNSAYFYKPVLHQYIVFMHDGGHFSAESFAEKSLRKFLDNYHQQDLNRKNNIALIWDLDQDREIFVSWQAIIKNDRGIRI